MDTEAVSDLYVQYGFAVHRRCLRLLGSRAAADDALQAVFMRVMRYGHTMRGDAPLPWLYRIADRHCLDVLRKTKREAGPQESQRHLERRADIEGADGAAPDRMSDVRRVLEHCAAKVQQIAVLYYVDEMTQEEVAATVGYSRKTVRQKLAEFLSIGRRVLGVTVAEKEKS